ncbi:hypothetical protein [Chromobacterium alticapitis]|uniref:Fibronectin type-III domain-containing protein n=1 Tax=Chromobacterium alticapitis TaxID=2073169 RepID=A0A2S5DE62_9NEIS|nr:hypothetical protein [Chromobacterium alticapitis]POZ61390.1 hypothetical protein C2I19_13660 [Chromobacterium alticapitis]
MNTIMKLLPLAVSSALLLTACGGGGDSTSNANAGNSGGTPASQGIGQVNGTVASGAPMENALLTFKDASGATIKASADENGAYQADLSKLKAPVLVEASGTIGGQDALLHSVITQSGVTNVTPLTEAMVALSAENDPAACFADSKCASLLTADKLAASSDNLQAALAPMLIAHGLDSKLDLLHTAFKADKTGQDKLLEIVKVTAGDNPGEIAMHSAFGNDELVVSHTQKPKTTILPPTKLPDFKGLDDLAKQLTAAYQRADGLSDRLQPLLSKNFNSYGDTAIQYIASAQDNASTLDPKTQYTGVGDKYGRPLIIRCDNDIRCEVKLTITPNKQPKYSYNAIVVRENNAWKLAGNDAPVSYELNTEAQQVIDVNKRTTTLDNLLYVSISTYSQLDQLNSYDPSSPAVERVHSAQLLAGDQILKSFTTQTGCGFTTEGVFGRMDSNPSCGPRFKLSDKEIQAYNLAVRKGSLKLRFFADTTFQKQIGRDVYQHALLFSGNDLKKQTFPSFDDASISKANNANGNTALNLNWTVPKSLTFSLLSLRMVQHTPTQMLHRDEGIEDPSMRSSTLQSQINAKLINPDAYRITLYALDTSGRSVLTRYMFR